MTLQLISRYFCAGLEIEAGRVTLAAPIIAWLRGHTIERVLAESRQRDWRVVRVP